MHEQAGVQEDAATPLPIRPFYNLYLISEAAAANEMARGERRVYLSHVGARTCAQLLEMLYVPVGRPGGLMECYLIFENREEFEAAARMAPHLDLSPISGSPSTIGAQESFYAGIAMLLHILDSGPVVDRPTAEACIQRLTEAAQTEMLSSLDRWAAGLLAGRVASMYLYDHAGARSLYQQAQRVVPDGSVEAMTARWWRADSFVLEGNASEAAVVYQGIVTNYGERWKNAQIVRRSRAYLEQARKR